MRRRNKPEHVTTMGFQLLGFDVSPVFGGIVAPWIVKKMRYRHVIEYVEQTLQKFIASIGKRFSHKTWCV